MKAKYIWKEAHKLAKRLNLMLHSYTPTGAVPHYRVSPVGKKNTDYHHCIDLFTGDQPNEVLIFLRGYQEALIDRSE